MALNIVICDDDIERIEEWKHDIATASSGTHTVNVLTGIDLVNALDSLFARSRTEQRPGPDFASVFDEADVVIIDSDLSPDKETLGRFSQEDSAVLSEGLRGQVGDVVAYNARVHTSAKLLIIVNQGYSDRTFDLTMRRFANQVGDLYLAEGDLVDPTLWSDVRGASSYQPWIWPTIERACERAEQFRVLVSDLDRTVTSALDLDISKLTADQLDVFGDLDPEDTTFRQIAKSQMGLRPNDLDVSEAAIIRMAASVTNRWFDRYLVLPQNVIADAAHLLQRFPNAFGSPTSLDAWNAISWELDPEKIFGGAAPALSTLSEFAERPLFDVSSVREIARTTSFPDDEMPELVFADDSSRFIMASEAREILTALPGNSARRYIEESGPVRYIPRVRRL